MQPEKQFQLKVEEFFKSNWIYPCGRLRKKRNGWYVKIWGGGFQRVGIPDILACIKGVFVAVELKSPRGKPSALQTLNIDNIRESGGMAYILYPKDFGVFKNEILALISGDLQELPLQVSS